MGIESAQVIAALTAALPLAFVIAPALGEIAARLRRRPDAAALPRPNDGPGDRNGRASGSRDESRFSGRTAEVSSIRIPSPN